MNARVAKLWSRQHHIFKTEFESRDKILLVILTHDLWAEIMRSQLLFQKKAWSSQLCLESLIRKPLETKKVKRIYKIMHSNAFFICFFLI